MAWRLSKGLEQLRTQINALFPLRSKVSDGAIGNAEHASRSSDHNPWVKDAKGMGVVTAVDITHDPERGVSGRMLADAATRDVRTKYVIFDGRIWKARTGQWERYTGPNAHKHHVHISIKPDVYDDISPWQLSASPVVEVAPEKPVLKFGDKGQAVRVAQAALKAKGYILAVDGNFGQISESVTKEFQRKHGLDETGVIDKATWAMLER